MSAAMEFFVPQDPKENGAKEKQFLVRFPPELKKMLSHLAVDYDISLNDLVVKVMGEWADKEPKAAKYKEESSSSKPAATKKASSKKP